MNYQIINKRINCKSGLLCVKILLNYTLFAILHLFRLLKRFWRQIWSTEGQSRQGKDCTLLDVIWQLLVYYMMHSDWLKAYEYHILPLISTVIFVVSCRLGLWGKNRDARLTKRLVKWNEAGCWENDKPFCSAHCNVILFYFWQIFRKDLVENLVSRKTELTRYSVLFFGSRIFRILESTESTL